MAIFTGCTSGELHETNSSPTLPASSVIPTVTFSPSPTPTVTAATITTLPTRILPAPPLPTATIVPSPTPAPPQYLDNDDCLNINRWHLPGARVVLSQGELSVAIHTETAASPSEQSQGLMCRESVPAGTGMLFPFETERTGGFWMFNTYVPLDIIFFAGDNGELAVVQMNPCPRDPEEETNAWSSRCGIESADYRPAISYRAALELPQGWLSSVGFDLSDTSGISVSID